MPEGRNSDNKRPSHRPQFHYFYGSVGTGGGGLGGRVGVVNGSSGNVSNVSLDDVSDADKDSLVGESLVSTDNEGASEEGDSIEGLLGPYNDDDHNDDDDYRYNDDLTGKNEYNRLLRSAATNGTNGHSSGVGSCSNISRNNRGSNKVSVLCCRSIWGVVISLAVVSLVTGVAIILFVPHNSDSSMSSSLSSLSSSSSSSLGSSESSGSSGSGTVLSSSSFPTQPLIIPFPKVDRSDYGDPVQNFIDTTLFHPDLLNKNEGGDSSNKYSFNKKSDKSSTSSTTFRFPFPTGAFWTNLIVDSPQGDGTSYPIAVYPYAYRWSQSSLQVSYPAAHRMATQRTISDTFAPDLSIEILEKVASRYVTAFDPLSVTLRYVTSPKSQFETALVQGSPYITLQYVSQTPIFRPLSIFEAVSCPGDSDENFSDIDTLDQDVTSSSSSMSPLYTSSSSGFENRNRRTRRRRTSSSFTDDERSATKRAPDQTRRTNDEQSAQKTRRLFGVCSIDDSSDSQLTTMRGVQFIFHTQEGARWIVFSSEPMNLLFDKVRKTTISSAAQFTGTIRLAYIPADKTLGASTIDNNASDNDNTKTFGSSTGLRRLIYHADAYPIGGEVSYEFKSTTSSSSANLSSLSSSKISSIDQSSRHATVTFSYKTRSMIGSSSSPSSPTSTSNLLMLALPHHADVMSSSVTRLSRKKFDLTYQCIKGNMTAIVGSSWSYNEPLYDLSFDGPVQTVDDDVRDLILQQVSDDLDRVLPTFSENIYGYGKQVARIAQLAHIADKFEPKVTTSAVDSSDNSTTLASNDDTSVLGKAKNILSKYLESFLSSKVSDALIFDSNMGGLVSTNGLHDKGEDFGNGRYNDHLFHYGYFLYASAVLARLDPSFIDRFGSHVDTLFHDIAHTSNGDSSAVGSEHTFFPFARHKSWFDGHSFATGMFPFGNGKSLESSSEAVNGYYGAYLWSLLRHGRDESAITEFARLLLSTEIRGAKTYWHMAPPKSSSGSSSRGSSNATSSTLERLHVYPPDFEQNYMVGNVGMLDVAVNTWFGADPLYVHMIQAIPITSITRLLFNKEYVEQEYPYLMEARSSVEMAWRGYTTCIHAIIDPNKAWNDAQDLVSYELDSALSKSQVLYFISQLPGFSARVPKTTKSTDRDAQSYNNKVSGDSGSSKSAIATSASTGSSSCEVNPQCASQGLTGECCPTAQDMFLDCCG